MSMSSVGIPFRNVTLLSNSQLVFTQFHQEKSYSHEKHRALLHGIRYSPVISYSFENSEIALTSHISHDKFLTLHTRHTIGDIVHNGRHPRVSRLTAGHTFCLTLVAAFILSFAALCVNIVPAETTAPCEWSVQMTLTLYNIFKVLSAIIVNGVW